MSLTAPTARAVIAGALLALLVGLAVWYGSLAPNPAMGAYPGDDDLAADYDRYVGEHVTVGGRVVATDPVVMHARVDAQTTLELTITDTPGGVAVGDHVRVFGVVEPGATIRAIRVIAQPPTRVWYAYTVSFLAGLWVLGRLVRDWTIDRGAWGIARREPPTSFRALARSVSRGGPEKDA